MPNIEREVRAKERRIENKQLKKRIKELSHSRDEWKIKAITRKEKYDELNQKLLVVKKKPSADPKPVGQTKPKRSHFRAIVILAIMAAKTNSSISFRSLSKVFVIINLYFKMELSTPSCSTTLLWIKKIGKAQLELPKEMPELNIAK